MQVAFLFAVLLGASFAYSSLAADEGAPSPRFDKSSGSGDMRSLMISAVATETIVPDIVIARITFNTQKSLSLFSYQQLRLFFVS